MRSLGLLLLALVGLAHAQEPSGFVRVQGWQADVDADDDDEARAGGTLEARLDLAEHLRLDMAYARTAAGFSRGHDLGYAQVRWRALRVGGGVVGDDWGLHVGAAPRLAVDATRWLRLEGGLDLAGGVAWLDEREGSDVLDGSSWRDAGRVGIDLYALSAAADLTLRLRPHEAFEVAVGAWVDAFVVAAGPGETDDLPAGFDRVARETDLGLSAALSRGAVGAHGTASLRLFRDTCALGSVTEVWLRYREAWDWVHLDPVYTVLAHTDPFDDVRLAHVPWRTTRTAELTASRTWDGDARVQATLDVRHVAGSTAEDFADRDGWSLGAALLASYAGVFASAHARVHLSDSPLEPLLGRMPRAQVGARGGVHLVASADVDVVVEAGFEVGRQDDWGVPRDGYAAWGALSVAFGGARGRHERLLLERGLLLPPLPRRGAPAGGTARLISIARRAADRGEALVDAVDGHLDQDGRALLEELFDPADVERFEDHARAAGLLDGGVEVDEVERFLDDPEVEAAVERRLPGVADVLRRVVHDDGRELRLDGRALLREPGTVLFAGYGADSAGAGVGWDGRLTLSRAWNLRRGDASPEDRARATVVDEDDADLLGQSTTLHLGGVLDLARAHRWQKLTIAEREGRRHRVVFQGATGWTRAMRLLLSGR